jgi:hypothetical protein
MYDLAEILLAAQAAALLNRRVILQLMNSLIAVMQNAPFTPA